MTYHGKIIDSHAHVQTSKVILDRRPFVETEPDFKLLYENPKYRLSSSSDVLAQMDESGVDASVILGFAWRDPQHLHEHNDMILKTSGDSGGRLYGFPCIYPFSEEAAFEAERCFNEGASGLGEIGLYDRDLDAEYIDAMKPVMKTCLDYDRPVLMHVNEPVGHLYSGKAPMSIKGIYDFVRAYPENRIILAHWGGGLFFFNALKKEAKDVLSKVWFDSAASPYLYDKSIWKIAVDIIGPEKILFGTDFPLLKPERYITELEESGLKQDDLECIMYKNAEALLRR